jgi:hypothetical protein
MFAALAGDAFGSIHAAPCSKGQLNVTRSTQANRRRGGGGATLTGGGWVGEGKARQIWHWLSKSGQAQNSKKDSGVKRFHGASSQNEPIGSVKGAPPCLHFQSNRSV